MKPYTQWHDKKLNFGLHYDLHAGKNDTTLGTRCSEEELVATLKLMNPDFVQTDCKGHAGLTSWFSKTKDASVPEGLKKDALMQWRNATKQLGLPLHCHYSGLWDIAIAEKHPDWSIQPYQGEDKKETKEQNFCKNPEQKLCTRSPYADEFMIPQMIELIDDYDVDGFWIDGDLWAMEPCYCSRCLAAWTEETGHKTPPHDEHDILWPEWWTFTLESFNAFVTRYCDAVHAHNPKVLVCSNWLQTFLNPGEPKVPTDWISGDNPWANGMDTSRCEARFLSTRKKHWDIMLWNFTKAGRMALVEKGWFAKPVDMLKQEAAVLLSFGGGVQLYEAPSNSGPVLRNGQLIPWRQKRMAEVGEFVRERREICQDCETIPQIAILHSEYHVRSTPNGKNLMYNIDVDPIRGATYSLLEKHYGVDILDEWALLPRLEEFPVIVVPERDKLSQEMVEALKGYVKNGGRLLVTGAESFTPFGADFLGVTEGKIADKATYFVAVGEESAGFHSDTWRMIESTKAEKLAFINETDIITEYQTPNVAVTLNKVGKGMVAYIPFGIFRSVQHTRNPNQRNFIGDIIKKLAPEMSITIDAPTCVDVALRRKGESQLIHFVNRNSGLPTTSDVIAVDDIPLVGPITVKVRCLKEPESVSLVFDKDKGKIASSFSKGILTVTLDYLHIHNIIEVN